LYALVEYDIVNLSIPVRKKKQREVRNNYNQEYTAWIFITRFCILQSAISMILES